MHYNVRLCWEWSVCLTRWHQSFYYNNSQCSIHPTDVIIKMCQISFKRSRLVLYQKIQNMIQHSFVYEVMSKVCEYLKGNYMHISKVKYFSDGCAVKHKNYKTFLNLCHHYIVILMWKQNGISLQPVMENRLLVG